MNENYIRNIVREQLLSALNEDTDEIEESPFTPAEEKFLAKFVELGTTSMGIIYAPNEIGIREFLGRSGKDFNLTPDVLAKLLKDKIISIVPYGGYSRNEDYTIQCNIPLDELEGLSSGTEEKGGETPPEDEGMPPEGGETPPPDADTPDAPEIPDGPPEESARSSKNLSKLLVSEAKKSKKKSKSKVHTKKARTLGRLPKGYVVHLERIIQILSGKLHTSLEKEHMVADILDNLAHNFGLTPQQIYKSFIFYRSQNRLQNVIKESLNEQSGPNPPSITIPFDTTFESGMYKQLQGTFKGDLNKALQGEIKKFLEDHQNNQIHITIIAGESRVTNKDNEVSPAVKVKPGYLSQKRGETLKAFLNTAFDRLVKEKAIAKPPTIDIKTEIGETPYPKYAPNHPKYLKEQFVKLIISVKGEAHACLVKLKISISYLKAKGGHTCDQAIFEVKANGVSLGIANLNNSIKDGFTVSGNTGKVYGWASRKRPELINKIGPAQKETAEEAGREYIRIRENHWYDSASEEEKENMRKIFSKKLKEIDPNLRPKVGKTKSGIEYLTWREPQDPEVSFAFRGGAVGGIARSVEGGAGGSRSQAFTLNDALAKKVIEGNDNIVISLKPLVDKTGPYWMFYNWTKDIGSHSSVPLVTIEDGAGKELVNEYPNISVKRGDTAEITLITLDKCGNKYEGTQVAKN